MIYSVLFIAAALFQTAPVTPEGSGETVPEFYSFAERQDQLVEMARLLGRMHHMHITCQPYDYLPDRFRDRMKELVALEEPPEATKSKMVAAFNNGFQSTKAAYQSCSAETETERRRLAKEGTVLTARLASPFNTIEGYDYYSEDEDVTN